MSVISRPIPQVESFVLEMETEAAQITSRFFKEKARVENVRLRCLAPAGLASRFASSHLGGFVSGDVGIEKDADRSVLEGAVKVILQKG